MPIETPKALRGLNGLKGLSKQEQWAFMDANADKLSNIKNLRKRRRTAEALYMNRQFIDKFGEDTFDKYAAGGQESFDFRNQILKHQVINEEFDKLYKPTKKNPKNGLGMQWNTYKDLSDDAKLKLMESDYLTPAEFETKWQKEKDTLDGKQKTADGKVYFKPQFIAGTAPMTSSLIKDNLYGEAEKKKAIDKNQKILDKIYNDDADNAAKLHASDVSAAYNDLHLFGMSDTQVDELFMREILHNSYKDKNGIPNMGIPTWEAYFYQNGKKKVQSEVAQLTIDEKRDILAKKKAYESTMSPMMARTALDNDAKRYIKNHQGTWTKFGLFGKDVAISSMSYTADKLNSVGELVRMSEDGLANVGVINKPVVYIDDAGNIVDINNVKSFKTKNGKLAYKDKDGQAHYLHKEQVDYTTLHNLGKNSDGSDIKGPQGLDWLTLNPVYWTRAEQFGTLDENLQKQYEELGVSPYKVMYNPNEDSDLLYESFKMMSFGLADAGAQLLPFGIGRVGKVLNEAKSLGKVVNGFGKVLDVAGKSLTAQSKFGQVTQGLLGAGGIGYAYGRGAFQETLAQNLANMEENETARVQSDIYNKYNTDKKYKANIDKQIDAVASKMKQQYLAQMRKDGGMQIADEKAIDKMIRSQAQDAVLAKEVEAGINESKASGRYAALQQEAIDGAGDTAFRTFLPEAIKYGLVNNFGYRKFLYQNPSGVTRRLSSSLKGLKEITTASGAKRLAIDASKFLTRGQKWKEFGKTVASQAWGGAWTNGTDDMMTDAAERINEDSFNQYLQAYNNGEALATTYGLMDGMFSYIKGLQNSLGQETTANSTIVGALGSLVNFTPNFVNIAHLATKEGRENYRNTFWRTVDRDANGIPLKNADGSIKYKQYTTKDKDGNPITTDINKKNNIRGQIDYFVQNGVLNTYYGKKAAERDLQSHADYVNNLLDSYKDFEDIEYTIASNLATNNMNPGDAKTMRFLNALYSINALRNLGVKEDDPTSLSSTVQKAKALIDRAAELNNEKGNSPFSEEEIKSLLSQYYATNKEIPQSEANSQKALYTIAQNAQKLQEAAKALEDANAEIQKIEKNRGEAIDPQVKTRLLINQSLTKHWEERNEKMKSEIDDTSSDEETTDPSVVVASLGGRRNAMSLSKVYTEQIEEIQKEYDEQLQEANKLKEEHIAAQKEVDSKEEGSTERLEAEKKEKEAKAKYEEAAMQVRHLAGLIDKSREKKNILEDTSSNAGVEENSTKYTKAKAEYEATKAEIEALKEKKKAWYDDKGKVKKGHNKQVKKADKELAALETKLAQSKEALEESKERILTADEIFNLDPVTRARMLNTENRGLYSREQQREIEKLEERLLTRDADALQKIQDIGLLTQRIKANKSAYRRIVTNPEAASVAVESQRMQTANAAYKLINRRSADTIAEWVNEFEEAMKYHPEESEEKKNKFVFKTLRKWSSSILDIIDKENLLPNYKKQVADAKEWNKTVEDIAAIIDSSDKDEAWKQNLVANIDRIVENSNNKAEIMSALEQVIDNVKNPNAVQDFEYLLDSMEKLGYQRDATVIESRKQRKEREEAEAKKREEERAKREAEAKAAAAKAAAEDAKKKAEEANKQLEANEGSSSSEAEAAYNKEVVDNAKPKTEVPADGKDITPKTPTDVVDVNTANAKLKSIAPGVWQADILLEDEAGDMSVDLGEIWENSGTPHKGKLTAERKGNTIRLSTEGNTTKLALSKEQYDISEGSNTEDNSAFIADSLVKKDGDWYFNGNFAGDNKITQVKAKKDFSLDDVIEELKNAREAEALSKGTDTGNNNLVFDGDSVMGKSATVEEQFDDALDNAGESEKEIHISEDAIDADDVNARGEYNVENSAVTLSGNAMSMYEYEPLQAEGKLVKKAGAKDGDTRNTYNAWMEAAGINLENIINTELSSIIRRNPHAKVKFMTVRPERNATNDVAMQGHLMLVLDYDNSVNKGITNIHNNDNGGVIESQGKKYLIIGVVGYGNKNAAKLAHYDTLWSNSRKSPNGIGLIKRGRKDFFDSHPQERYWVNEEYSTEIPPNGITPGYIVKQTETDETTHDRSVRELLEPTGKSLDKVAWGIQERTKFLVVGADVSQVMVPRDSEGNMGSAFVLIPAGNGKLVPSYLKVLKYQQMQDGTLKDKVNTLLQNVTSLDYQTRIDAIIELSKIFYLSKEGDDILTRKNRAELSLVHDGEVEATFDLNNFDRAKFLKAFATLNPRVNITAQVLKSAERLKEYDEAGALMTDAAAFHTAGSSYSIYPLDANGKMIIPQQSSNTASTSSSNSDFRNTNKRQIIFKGNYYVEDNGVYYYNGIPVTNEKDIKQLEYNKRIIDNQLLPVVTDKTWNYYILSTGEHPEAIKVDRNTQEVRVSTEEQAKALIEKIAKEEAEKAREAAAKTTMDKALDEGTAKVESVDLDDTGGISMDPNTGEIITTGETETKEDKDASEETPATSKPIPKTPLNATHTSTAELDGGNKKGSQKFSELIKNKTYKVKIITLIKGKWKEAPKKMTEWENFLRSKDIEVDSIGTSDKDINAWLDTIRDCRE